VVIGVSVALLAIMSAAGSYKTPEKAASILNKISLKRILNNFEGQKILVCDKNLNVHVKFPS
jgi:hypothetical protein